MTESRQSAAFWGAADRVPKTAVAGRAPGLPKDKR